MPKLPAPADDELPPDPREFRLVRAGDLEIDPREQRNLNDKAVDKIVNGFDWIVFEVISVRLLANGRLKVFEGQHRVRAVQRLNPDTLVPCMIIKDEDFNSSAAALAIAEGRRSHTAIDRWRLRLFNNEEREVLATQAMHDRGVDVGTTKCAEQINAVVLVERIMNHEDTFEDGAIVLGRVIDAIRETWPDYQDDAAVRWEGALMEAVWTVIADFDDLITHAHLVKILTQRPIRYWINVGKPGTRSADQTAAQAIAEQILVDFDAMEKSKAKRGAKK